MYAWLLRRIPGPLWLRVLIVVVVLALVVLALFTIVFPAVAPFMPFNDGTVGGA